MIDDPAASYSSLASLRTLRVERIKIDRGFVTDSERREGDRSLVQAILGIGPLGIELVTEGVEGAEEALILARCGCRVVQGYYFARPMPQPDLDAWIRAADARTSSFETSVRPHETRADIGTT